MSDSLINLQRRKHSAEDLSSVVRTMKAMATSNITHYEMAVDALQDYYRTIALGLYAAFRSEQLVVTEETAVGDAHTIALIFGSDQGLVGRFNNAIVDYGLEALEDMPGETEIWAVGERAYVLLEDSGLRPERLFAVPHSVSAITPFVNHILIASNEQREQYRNYRFHIFHNAPAASQGYHQQGQRLYPPGDAWQKDIVDLRWPSKNLPQVIGAGGSTLSALIREYLFVSLYKATAESIAAENASRLEAMQRAEKNIDEMLDELRLGYNRLRQSTIDAELFDVIAGFEALKKE